MRDPKRWGFFDYLKAAVQIVGALAAIGMALLLAGIIARCAWDLVRLGFTLW